MGKRKYENENTTEKTGTNTTEGNESGLIDQPQSQDENEIKGKEKRAKVSGFDIKHFRKELSAKQGQTMVLTQFLQACLNPDDEVDYLLDYLRAGGNSHEILRQINQESKKNLTLTTPAFHIFHLIILKVQSSLPHMIAITEETCRYFLNNFMSTVEIMISENSGPRHRKIILKLLTSMVTLNPDLGVEVLSHAPLSPKHLQYITEKTNYKEKDNVRTAFVHFMTSFLIDGHLPLIKALLEKQGLLALVIPGLVHDEAEAVLMFLNILKKNVIENNFVSKSLKLKTFSHQVLHNIFKIFSWKGPLELKHELRTEMHLEIMNLLSDIILTLFTSHKLGLYFLDGNLGTTDVNKNMNLYKALLTLKRPWENKYQCNTILQIVYSCPDLHRAVMNIVEQSFEPQHSPIWEGTVNFVIKLLDKMKPEHLVPRMNSLNAIQAANFVRFVTLPVPLLRFIQTNLGKDITISLYCIKVLVKMLQTLKKYMDIIEMEESSCRILDLKNKLDYFLPKHLPVPTVIVSLVQDIVTNKVVADEKPDNYRLPRVRTTDALLLLTDLLLLYNDIQPTFFEVLEGNIDIKQILDFSTSLEGDSVALLKFKIVSLWIALDNSVISLKNPMFKELFIIMLEVYINDQNEIWVEAKSTLHKFLKNTGIFEADEDEIHLLLYSLRNSVVSPISLIANVIEYVLINIKDLTYYIKNQTEKFEISNGDSDASLGKLFDDLMENRNIEDSIFLENKVPSIFIVGCIQFMQSNKVKRNLKHFVSLYIGNLFHCNYSPELTEVLIGDAKLDIRSYISSWVVQAASLPEDIIVKDKTLLNISKSIIDKEELTLNQIFTCCKESTDEENVFVNEIALKVNLSNKIDSSELYVWAKYLIFCTVRLTYMEELDEDRQKKIINYILCLITIGKKSHMINECRAILMSLFKNTHVLKIYQPIMFKQNVSTLLATDCLLDIITLHTDIVNYLNNKHKILKSYQQKNYSELTKAFVKINEMKNFDSKHFVKVLEIVGMTHEDDLHIFNKIFSIDASYCVKDDKEPSFVLDILRTLIEKYSKSAVDSPEHVIRKSVKLYTELLINKEVNPNLTDLESALTEYFENKPHHTTYVNDEIFKNFFNAVTVRKSTSQLAAVLLRHNSRLCNIFKAQASRPEILNQRELTLPLGNAAVNHKQFLVDHKDFLNLVYAEYKSNINKMLEKPHKAGQIYIACWEFIRKLVVECMEIQECTKLFSKSHKYEVVELSHINLLQAIFIKLCLSEKNNKNEYLINYILTTLHTSTSALKDGKETETLITLVINISDAIDVSENTGFFDFAKKDFKKITDSGVWQNFCKAVLKESLKVKTASQGSSAGPHLLYLLTRLVKLFYPIDHEDIISLFDMVTSHSEFLNVMLSHHSSDIKSRLIAFLYTLIQLNKSVMKSQQIPVYLSSYHATRSPCDRLILSILHFYESNGLPVNEYKPYVFGDSAANHYAVRKSRTSSLWGQPTPNRILNLFEKEIVDRTVRSFPVTQKHEYHYELAPVNACSLKESLHKISKEGIFKAKVVKDNETAIKILLAKTKYEKVVGVEDMVVFSHLDEDCSIYDPMFLFPLLSHLLAPGSVASCFKLLRSGLLSVAVMALSSECPMMRASAYHVLHRFCLLLETETRHKNDKLFLTDFIRTLRRSLITAIDNSSNENGELKNLKNFRLPAVSALYFARALMVSAAPSDPLYKSVNNFFIAKQEVDLTVVPDFLTLFHDSDVEAADRRMWILEIIKDGTRTMTDVNVVFKTMCMKMCMDFYSSVLCDRKVREKILNALNSVIAVPRALEILIEGYGLISWLHAAVAQLRREDKILVNELLHVIENIIHSVVVNSYVKHCALSKNGARIGEFKINKDTENEMLILLYDLLPHTFGLDVEDIVTYIQKYNFLSKRAIKCLTKKQILTLVTKTGSYVKENENVKLLTDAIIGNDCNILKSKFISVKLQENDRLLQELLSLVKTYIVF
ncbi:unnamed protein product [Diatraea saccharalis]|uniref:Nucleolar pre-ribosomal-associated protein 1 n=1 Tax=Diatraea saccharalis TaxID=40085 RepID=A0A9N9R2V6_9NEOP|nr:unnamed protein product [Diatraea saccharalis]